MAREVELAVVGESLVREDQHRILGEGRADRGEVVGAERTREIDITDFGNEIRRDSVDGDGQGFLPILCSAVIGPPKARDRKCLS